MGLHLQCAAYQWFLAVFPIYIHGVCLGGRLHEPRIALTYLPGAPCRESTSPRPEVRNQRGVCVCVCVCVRVCVTTLSVSGPRVSNGQPTPSGKPLPGPSPGPSAGPYWLRSARRWLYWSQWRRAVVAEAASRLASRRSHLRSQLHNCGQLISWQPLHRSSHVQFLKLLITLRRRTFNV